MQYVLYLCMYMCGSTQQLITDADIERSLLARTRKYRNVSVKKVLRVSTEFVQRADKTIAIKYIVFQFKQWWAPVKFNHQPIARHSTIFDSNLAELCNYHQMNLITIILITWTLWWGWWSINRTHYPTHVKNLTAFHRTFSHPIYEP